MSKIPPSHQAPDDVTPFSIIFHPRSSKIKKLSPSLYTWWWMTFWCGARGSTSRFRETTKNTNQAREALNAFIGTGECYTSVRSDECATTPPSLSAVDGKHSSSNAEQSFDGVRHLTQTQLHRHNRFHNHIELRLQRFSFSSSFLPTNSFVKHAAKQSQKWENWISCWRFILFCACRYSFAI